MFFKREEIQQIDGKSYPVSPGAHFDHYKCKELICGIFFHIGKDNYGAVDKNNYNGFKKDLASKLKEFDKHYVKHGKTINPELAEIHKAALMPLVNLCESNFNYHHFNRLLDNGEDLPDFRFKALETRYVEHMTKVCEILTLYQVKGSEENHGPLSTPYDIQKMLTVMKTKNWKTTPALHFYI